MKTLLILFLSLLVGSAATLRTDMIWEDEFESGDNHALDTIRMSSYDNSFYAYGESATNYAHSGMYSLKAIAKDGPYLRDFQWRFLLTTIPYQTLQFPRWNYVSTNALYWRLYVLISSSNNCPNAATVTIASWDTGGEVERLFAIKQADSTWKFKSAKVNLTTSATFAQDTWICVNGLYKYGTNDAEIAYWFNGEELLRTNTATSPLSTTFQFGHRGLFTVANSNLYGSFYYDDFWLGHTNVGTNVAAAKMYCPDLLGRIGVSPLLISSFDNAGGSVLWSLVNSEGTTAKCTNDFKRQVRGYIPLRSVPQGTNTLYASIRNSGGTEIASAQYDWDKTYEGEPFCAINEYNAWCTNGEPVFFVTEHWDNPGSGGGVSNFLSKGLINAHLGNSYSDTYGPGRSVTAMSNIIKFAWTNYQAGSFATVEPYGVSYIDTNVIIDLITNVAFMDGLLGWSWEDEPDITPSITPEMYFNCLSFSKSFNPRINVHINMLGGFAEYVGVPSEWYTITSKETRMTNPMGKGRAARGFCWPFLVVDSIGYDMYPYSYTNNASISSYCVSSKRLGGYVHNLLPMSSFVIPNKRVDTDYIKPTTNQVNFLFWSAISCGTTFMQWFQYHVHPHDYEPEYFQTMSNMVKQANQFKHVIYARENDRVTCDQSYPWQNQPWDDELYGPTNGVFYKATVVGSTNYIIAANVKTNATQVFRDSFLTNGMAVKSAVSGTTYTATDGAVTVNLPIETYDILYYSGEAAPQQPTGRRLKLKLRK